MRLFGVAMVRDEADVIEAFVRHNLSVLDGLTIGDHGSLDGTSEILAKLQDEGLALRVVQIRDSAFFQSRRVTELARETLSSDKAEFVFALDADEFLKLPSRARLESALSAVPPGMHVLAHWLTYVPDDLDAPGAFGPGHLWWRLKNERHAMHKLIVSRALLDQPAAMIAFGNHLVSEPDAATPPRHARLPADIVAFAHCPIRSREQLCAKVITGYLRSQAPGATLAEHWGDLYQELRDGATLSPERVRETARNYTLPRARWRPADEIELVEDPVPLAFELRYLASAAPDTLRRVMRFAEALVERRNARTPSGIVEL